MCEGDSHLGDLKRGELGESKRIESLGVEYGAIDRTPREVVVSFTGGDLGYLVGEREAFVTCSFVFGNQECDSKQGKLRLGKP